jgi:hypothetical protein
MLTWKGFGRKRLWHNFKVLSRPSPGGTQENHEKLSHDSRFLGQDFNLGPSKYEAEVSSSQARHSFMLVMTVRPTNAVRLTL